VCSCTTNCGSRKRSVINGISTDKRACIDLVEHQLPDCRLHGSYPEMGLLDIRTHVLFDSGRMPHASEAGGTLHVDGTRVYVISRPEVDWGSRNKSACSGIGANSCRVTRTRQRKNSQRP
jgi:hypothetical protein